MNVPLPVILLLLAATLTTAVWALYEFAAGLEQKRRLSARGALDDAEARADGLLGRLDVRLRRTDLGRTVGRRIAASGMRIRVSTFLILMATGIVLTIIVIGEWMAPLFGIAAAVGVVYVFFAYLRRKEDRRKEEFISQLPELARVLSNATHAGLVLRTAIEMAADELDEPARSELRRTSDSLKLGQPVEAALRDLSERLPSRELGVLVSTLVVAARSGGSLVTALRGIADTLEDRKETRREIKTIMGEAVVTNWAIGAMGIGALVLVNLSSPGALHKMSSTLIGQIILGVGFVMFSLSLVIVNRIVRIDV